MRALVLIQLFAVAAGCGSGGKAPRIRPAELPAEARGLMPGVATEADVKAALPTAVVERDRSLGGNVLAELHDKPGVRYRDEAAKLEVWLVELDGQLHVADVRVPVTDACKGALQALAGAKHGTCEATNRKFDKTEHRRCATTPDGKYAISIACDERSAELEMHLRFPGASCCSYMVNHDPP